MPPQAPTDGLKDASWEDIITAIAKRERVNPMLALSVASKEATNPKTGKLDPYAVGDGGKAIGLFQMHSGAAQDTGITDRHDPIQNITGGVRYLRQLSDRYDGDPNKMLMAYNGGSKWVDEGTVSPAAQAYAADVMARFSERARASSTAKPQPRPTGVTQPSVAQSQTGATLAKTTGLIPGAGPGPIAMALHPWDPRYSEGRENLAATAGSVALMAATKGIPTSGVLPWITRALASTVGAGGGGAAAAAVEGGDPLKAGARQAGYDVAGRAIAWPIVGVLKRTVAPGIARRAAEGIESRMTAAQETGREMVQTVRNELSEALRIVRQTGRQAVQGVKEQAGAYVEGAKRFAAGQTDDAKRKAAGALADADLATADLIGRLQSEYDTLLKAAPETQAVAGDVTKTLGGLPKTMHVEAGPVKRALDIAGQRVAQVAEQGPTISLAPIRDAINEMVAQKHPTSLLGAPPGPKALPGVQARPSGMTPGQRVSREEYQALVQQELGLPEGHKLPGLLGDIMAAPTDAIPFRDAHKLKMLLDESVNWSQPEKLALRRMTKGVRSQLRSLMGEFQPYNDATAAYQSVVRLHTEGIGKRLVAAASSNPDAVVKMLDQGGVVGAKTMRQLLVDQAAAGGDAALGQQAWDGVRSAYTYRKLLTGGIDGLSERVQTLVTENPEFAKEIYGDPKGQQILSNFSRLGEAAKVAQANAGNARAVMKQQGAEDVLDAATAAERGVGDAKVLAERQVSGATEDARRSLEATRAAGGSRVQEVQRLARQGVKDVKGEAKAFGESSLRGYAKPRAAEEEFADAWRLALLAPKGSWLGGLSLFRLIAHPVKGKDLLQYVGYSDELTQKYVKGLLGGLPPQGVASLVRELGTLMTTDPEPEPIP